MRIEVNGDDDLEEALREIHKLALAYEGPMVEAFMELARVSSPIEMDELLAQDLDDDAESSRSNNVSRQSGNEINTRFQDALSLLMELAFPLNEGTEQEVRSQINELIGADGWIASLNMLVGERKYNLAENLEHLPTKDQIELRDALIELLPRQTEVDL